MRSMMVMILLGVVVVGLVGCTSGDGQTRFRVSGDATFDGKPIPFGDVLFTPNGAKKNSGAQGIATIRDGKFDTAQGGKGVGGGPMIVRVTGLSAQGGQLLCEYEYEADLPQQDSAQKIDVPAKAGAKKSNKVDI
jgi:hypothetical protein